MYAFPNEPLDRCRTLEQALIELRAKHGNMARNHPQRARLARMILQLQTEIVIRGK
jgi:hypothetical protein